ncbi:hypothetical protein PGTUg99_006879 [Puccinia graminis f. sp. tritici]|uniref:Uncharacterized protein n=1 Tax=Puccinia graminis f. sp. tritici TaxID=56615 RepID=A0A5B0RW95_PUCGR|nr:hypothetical protein PGTUg99_006879 [Puccinia graminis f. sp. tritici]
MTQQWSRRPFSPTENRYDSRIRYLEEVVHLLLAGTNSTCFSLSTPTLAGSFRYSIKRGLEPVLPDKTAMSLVADWRIGRPIRQKRFSSPPCRQNRLLATCNTSLHPARVPSPTPSTSLTNPASPATIGVADSTNTAKSSSTSNTEHQAAVNPMEVSASPTDSITTLGFAANTAQNYTPQLADPHSPPPVNHCSSPDSPVSHKRGLAGAFSFELPPPALAISLERPTSLEAHASHAITLTQRSNSANVVEPNNFSSLDNTAATATAVIDLINNNAIQNKGPSPFPPPSSSSSAHPSTTAIIIESHDQSSTLLVVNGPAPITSTVTTSAPSRSYDHQLTFISATDAVIAPTSLSCLNLINNKDNQDNLLPTTNLAQSFTDTIDDNITSFPVTLPIDPTLPLPSVINNLDLVCHQTQPIKPPAQPDNFEVAAVGGIEILDNENSNAIDARLAPEYSQATLDYYNDIQEYLQQANTEGTEMKKKKKKKKKKKANLTSTPDNPILFYV